MRAKFLLFVFLLWAGTISAQIYHHNDTVKTLVITEYRGDNTHHTYLELTNMGNEPIQLGQFKIGYWGGGSTLNLETWKTNYHNIHYSLNNLKCFILSIMALVMAQFLCLERRDCLFTDSR